MNSFASRVIAWQRRHGRNTLPWQANRDPYRVWLSEIMLQQTQVATVVPYFERFTTRFPDLASLAAADEDDVLALWSGLGYYSRARNLHAAAREIVAAHGGRFPATQMAIAELPGVGRSTAAAIAATAFGEHCAILDGNVKRVLARHRGVEGWTGERTVENTLWRLADTLLPASGIEAYTQGMMDLGALVCTRSRPQCAACPVHDDCLARTYGRTEELPSPRPRKTLPEKAVQMLLLIERGALLLEKRPAKGIWGGLWSLPELAPEDDATTICHRLGLRVASRQDLDPLAHTFTHFRLQILPVRLELAARGAPSEKQAWFAPEQALAAGLPAPVRKLVAGLVMS